MRTARRNEDTTRARHFLGYFVSCCRPADVISSAGCHKPADKMLCLFCWSDPFSLAPVVFSIESALSARLTLSLFILRTNFARGLSLQVALAIRDGIRTHGIDAAHATVLNKLDYTFVYFNISFKNCIYFTATLWDNVRSTTTCVYCGYKHFNMLRRYVITECFVVLWTLICEGGVICDVSGSIWVTNSVLYCLPLPLTHNEEINNL